MINRRHMIALAAAIVPGCNAYPNHGPWRYRRYDNKNPVTIARALLEEREYEVDDKSFDIAEAYCDDHNFRSSLELTPAKSLTRCLEELSADMNGVYDFMFTLDSKFNLIAVVRV